MNSLERQIEILRTSLDAITACPPVYRKSWIDALWATPSSLPNEAELDGYAKPPVKTAWP